MTPSETATTRRYDVTFMYRPEAHVPAYRTTTYRENAYTAEDAVTQLRVRCSGYLELWVMSVEPADEPS